MSEPESSLHISGLPNSIHHALEQIADTEHRSKSQQSVKFLTEKVQEWIADHPESAAQLKIGTAAKL